MELASAIHDRRCIVIWPHVLNQYARKLIEGNGGEVVFEEYYPLDQMDFASVKGE